MSALTADRNCPVWWRSVKKSGTKRRPMKAWLITRGPGQYAALAKGEVVDILSARKSIEDVRQYVQRLHDLFYLTLCERAEGARYNRKEAPIYEAKVSWPTLPSAPKIGGVIPPDRSRGPQIYCGHDPCFAAQLVQNVVVAREDETGRERINWEPWRRGRDRGPQ